MSHEADVLDTANEDAAARTRLKVIERVTGWHPRTCPWRAMYHPLVREVMGILPIIDTPAVGAMALPPNTPNVLIEAIAEYRRALEATRYEDRKLHLEKLKREREAGGR